MKIEDELKKLERSKAIRIVANVLSHISADQYKLVIAAVHKDTIGVVQGRTQQEVDERPDYSTSDLKGEPADIILIAEPDATHYPKNVLEYLDEGCDYGKCEKCGVQLMCSFKEVLCPLCGEKTHLT